MRIIILGASGRIGKAVLELLKNEPLEVIGTSRYAGEGSWLLKFDPFKDDWKMLGFADVVINCIGIIKEKRTSRYEQIHIGLTRAIVRHRKAIGNPKIIQVSALGASTDHPVRFLKTKGVADAILLQEENTYVIRPSIVCTPDTLLLQKIKMLRRWARFTNNHLFLPKGFLFTAVQPVLISDLTAVITRVAKQHCPFQLIEVVGPEPISYCDLINLAMSERWSYQEVRESLVRYLVKYFIAPVFPALITFDQYQLLFYPNTASSSVVEKVLGRKLKNTDDFWRNCKSSTKSGLVQS